MKYLADIPLGPGGGYKPPNTTGILANPALGPGGTIERVISISIALMTSIAFIYYMYRFIMGAIAIITAGGDKVKLGDARKDLTTSTIGVIFVIAAIFIIQFLGWILGINILNPAAIL